MNIISFNDIIECNALMKEKGLNSKIHLRDACGKQSGWIESLEQNADEQQEARVRVELDSFFEKKRLELEYSEDLKNFWIKSK